MVPPAMWTIIARKAASARRALRVPIAKAAMISIAKIMACANRMRPVVRLTATVRTVTEDDDAKRAYAMGIVAVTVNARYDWRIQRVCVIRATGANSVSPIRVWTTARTVAFAPTKIRVCRANVHLITKANVAILHCGVHMENAMILNHARIIFV